MGFKVLIVGCGAQGKIISTWMSRAPEVEEIKICDIDYEACKKHVDRLATDKLTAYNVDASNVEEVASLASGMDVLVNAVIPVFNLSLMNASLRSGTNYMDLAFGPPYETLHKQLEKDDDFKDHGLTALLCAGQSPGITNLLVSKAADELDSIDTVRLRMYDAVEGTERISTWSPETLFGDFSLEPLIYENGELKAVPVFSGEETYNFPEPYGPKNVVYHIHEEILMIPHFIGKGVKNIDLKIGSPDLEEVKTFIRLGLWSDEPIEVKGATVTPRDVLLKLLPPTPSFEEVEKYLIEGKLIDSYGVLVIEVHGIRAGINISYEYVVIPPTLIEAQKTLPGATHESYVTGTSASIFLKTLGLGKIRKKGVISTGCLGKESRENVLNALIKKDIKISEKIERQLN